MREVAEDIERWMARGERVALATLVHVQRSAPRLPGAHCAVSEGGAIAGAISAGCVENDLIEWSRAVLEDGRPRLASYEVADADAMRIGLTCGGEIDVLVESLADRRAAWEAALRAIRADRPVVLAVAVAPAELCGRRMFLLDEPVGSISGDADPRIVEEMRRRAATRGSANVEIQGAGGAVRVFIESVAPPPRLIVVGATQTALPLCRMARQLDFHVTVIDPREVYSGGERLRDADVVLREWPDRALESVGLDGDCHVVVLTHDAKFDLPALRCALRSEARYIGALGSRRTHAVRVAALREEGFAEEQLARVHAPIGLDLGGRAPAEIALSILAEITALRYGKVPGEAGRAAVGARAGGSDPAGSRAGRDAAQPASR